MHKFFFECQGKCLLFLDVSASVSKKKIKLLIFTSNPPPPLWGIPGGFCDCGPTRQSAHSQATSDFLPRSESLGTPRWQGLCS